MTKGPLFDGEGKISCVESRAETFEFILFLSTFSIRSISGVANV
jgi:hypothetical protein